MRDAIDAVVRAALNDSPTVIVSHSLGTVVTYNVLRNSNQPGKVPLLVTIGSPLGVRAVRDRLRPLSFPNGVEAWFNAYDTRDVVSLYALDTANFPLNPTIVNHSAVRNHTDNRHGIDGYLDDRLVVDRVLSMLPPLV